MIHYIIAGLTALLLGLGNGDVIMQKATSGQDLRSFPPSDTLVYHAAPGKTLITVLPDSAHHIPVVQYKPVRLPALSWLVDRSFFWYIRPRDKGIYHLLFIRQLKDASSDTLVVTVYVQD